MNSTSVGHTFPEKFGAANEDNVEDMGCTFSREWSENNSQCTNWSALLSIHHSQEAILELELKLRVVQLSICTEIEVH